MNTTAVVENSFFRVHVLFCEYKYLGISNVWGGGSRTEVVGTISNLAFIVLGICALRFSTKATTLVRLWCGMLCAIGIGSSLYHATGFDGCRMFDIIPMSTFAFLVCFYSADLCMSRIRVHGVRYVVRGVVWVILACYMVFSLAG